MRIFSIFAFVLLFCVPIIAQASLPGFVVQAPEAKWSDPWGEMCEEAVILMATRWQNGQGAFSTRSQAVSAFRSLQKWEMRHLNTYVDTTVSDARAMAVDALQTPIDRVLEVSDDDGRGMERIIGALADGDVVYLPTAGRLLGNPHFKSPGPIFHALLLYGYDSYTETFVTHDPGTRFGANFRYPKFVLDRAWHDWNGKKSITDGSRRALVFLAPNAKEKKEQSR